MKWNPKRDILPLCIFALFGLFSVYFGRILPDIIPSHFDSQGIPDGYSSKSSVILVNLGLALGVYALLTFIPFLDPFWSRIESKYNVLLIFRDLAVAFLLFIFVIAMRSASEGRFQMEGVGIGFGLLFIFLGNYMPKLPRNFFFGIRSPWTLASDTVWRKTHVVSGWLFVLSGAAVIALSLLNLNIEVILLVTILPVVIISGIVYPLLLYKKLQREGKLSIPEL